MINSKGMKKIEYPDRTSADFDKLKLDYKSIFLPAELSSMQTGWDNWKLTHHVTTIPETVEELMLADVADLADIYESFRALPIPEKVPDPNGRFVKSQEYKDLEAIFKYSRHFDDRIAKFFREHADQLHISSCYYCELAYVNVYTVVVRNSASTYQHFDVDHFLPKAKCPIIALSLFNFVPSCHVCNSRIKLSYVLGTSKAQWVKFNPVSDAYNFEDNVKIRLRMHRGPDTTFKKKGDYYIYFRCKNGFRTSVDFFRLEERYEFHKSEAMRLKQLKAQYPQSARRKIARLLGTTEAKVKEDLFHEHFLNDNGRCFAKLTRDMLR